MDIDRNISIGSNQATFTNIYVKKLDKKTVKTTAELKDLFKEFGTITSAKLITYKNVSKGFGYVNFETHESAVKAIEGRNNYPLAGKVIYVTRALSRKEQRIARQSARSNRDSLKKTI